MLAMDHRNADHLRASRPRPRRRDKARLLRGSTRPPTAGDLDVPDPYYGEDDGFADGVRPGRRRLPRPARPPRAASTAVTAGRRARPLERALGAPSSRAGSPGGDINDA